MDKEDKRSKLLDTISEDTNKITVGNVMHIFVGILDGQEKHSDSFKTIKNKVTEKEWIQFMNSLIASFSVSLYVSASKDYDEVNKRMAMVEDATSDLIIGVEEETQEKVGKA